MNKERLVAALESAYHEGQQYRQQAKLRALPPDPAKWLDEYEAYACDLPDDLPQRRVMLSQVVQARKHLAEGDTDEAKFYMLQIEENWSNAEHDMWVLRIDRGSSAGGRSAAESRQSEKATRAQQARDHFDRLAHVPERERASMIAQKMGLHPKTVRRYLKQK